MHARALLLLSLQAETFRLMCSVQACVWTEYISDEATAEYMTFPRLSALAECVWSAPHRHDWEDFVARLKTHVRFFEAMELEYRPVG